MPILSAQTSSTLYHLIDLLWIPVSWFAVHKNQRWKVLVFIIACLATFRTEVELIGTMGTGVGYFHLLPWPVYTRGLVAYSVVIMFYLILAHYSPNTHKMVFFAASLSIYVLAFAASLVLMIL